MKELKEYLEPQVQFLTITVEHGFANSLEDPEEQPEIDW